MNKKNYKEQKNDNFCWILDYKIKDVLPFFFIKLELKDIKNIRLVCIKFKNIIDNHNLFNLIFRLRVYRKTEKQELEKIIKKYPIITSLFFRDLIFKDFSEYIPNYIKEL